jgi:hypothetical protein
MTSSIVRYLRPWALKRERHAESVRLLRTRDGDNCARCRRPLRFDLPAGHDQGASVEPLVPDAPPGTTIDNFRLCHRRCFAPGMDHTGEVTERMRRKNEAALLSKARPRKTKAA